MQDMHIYSDIDSAWQLFPKSAYTYIKLQRKWSLCVDLQIKTE